MVTAADGATRLIELNQPEKLNCLSLAMLAGVRTALEGNTAGRIVLTGGGRAFCTGLDLDEVAATNGGRDHLRQLVAIYRWLLETDADTVAFARGYAVGGGAGLLSCARRAIVAGDFRYRLPGGKLSSLAAVVPPLCEFRAGGKRPDGSGWLGCDLDADEARRLGLVDQVVSEGDLGDLIGAAREGRLPPGFRKPVVRDAVATATALAELDRFLERLEAQRLDGR